MGSERFEVESEAWYRAVAEGRLVPVSDGGGEQTRRVWPPVTPDGFRPVIGENGWSLTPGVGERTFA